jgi:hypothetical protein
MPSQTIVIQTHDSQNHTSKEGSKWYITYTLADILKFDEPHYARLLYLGGTKEICLVFADFLKRQNVNGVLVPYLGCSSTAASASWVPLSSNHIPQTGVITLISTTLTALTATSKITICIEVAPESWINGTESQA